ncbi:microtubule-actin cross-linking factor 1, isoforms 6/7-like isoform X3 [Gopherus flavomarginatus]|uniref:microtubule-actin cross-linking factor 1, isoforms 6/7-like isoform X3 n=1 Tax=Gopherus flavomarginatus TaxID=286002 RepID=UPI0021CBDE37|nr:microtubule-actin cross-linking factor 1, isoforms 6/7-like isoform X3 [Gopherus flavomarginatus]
MMLVSLERARRSPRQAPRGWRGTGRGASGRLGGWKCGSSCSPCAAGWTPWRRGSRPCPTESPAQRLTLSSRAELLAPGRPALCYPLAMGNVLGRPSCLGDKSQKPEDFLKDVGLGPEHPVGRNNCDARAGAPDKSPLNPVIENGWNLSLGSAKSQLSSPLPKQNNMEVKVQNGSRGCNSLKAQLEAAEATWTPPRGAPHRDSGSSWAWKPVSTREVTEVTEVTETIVTEIVEVTEYPGGEPVVTRMVKVLTECAGERTEGALQAITLPEGSLSVEQAQDTLETLLTWVADMEDLVANQKPPSSEVKVLKAQLQEQKLLKRLLEERRSRVECVLQDRWLPREHAARTNGQWASGGLSGLQEKWGKLIQKANTRHSCLERILPAAQCFQESVDSFQEWLSATERRLAQLWHANGCMTQLQAAHQQSQGLCEEIRSRMGDLEQALERGQQVLELVIGEEAQLAQEKMESLRMRYLIMGQSSGDIQRRLAQTLEASSHVDSAQEDLALWLGRMEKELAPGDSQPADGPHPVSASDREKFEQVLGAEHAHLARLGQHLEELRQVQLDAQAICSQLSTQQLLSAEILHHRGLVERLLGISDPLLRTWPLPSHQHPQCLREALAEHRPLMGKLQRVSAQLAELSPEQGTPFQQQCQAAEEQYSSIREHVCQAAMVLEDAIPRYSQLMERMDFLLESLERLQGRVQNPPVVRGDAAHLREQICENSLALGELEKLGVGLETVRSQGAELLASKQMAHADAAAKVIQERTEQLCSQWRCLCGQAEERERWLRGLLALAERFWQGLAELAVSLTDTQQMVLDLEEAGSDPEAVRARLCTMQALREEIDVLQNDLDTLGILGVELMSSCGDPDKPDVTKSLDDLYSSWHSLSKVWTERQGRLQEQLQASLRYQKAMQGLCDWLAMAELRMAEEFLIGGDLELVRQQLAELKEFKRELYQCKVDVESLRHHAGAEDRGPPALLSDFRERWDCLEEEIVSRQHQLEAALLALGQFQNQLEELLQWISHTAEQLQGQTPLSLDLQSCEIELAKHKVLRNDVMSHARTVQSVNEVGQGLLLSSLGDSTDSLQCSLQQLNQRWDFVRSETESRQLELENNLSQVQDVTLEIMDLLQWLEHVELRLFFSKPVWDHPETTKEKLAAHLELAKELESKQQAYNSVRDRLQRLLASCSLPRVCSTEHSLRVLQQKWESVHSQVQERKERLVEGLTLSTEFHSTAQELLQWLGQTEESLSAPEPPSFLLDTVLRQIQEHKALLKEVTAHGEQLSSLEAVAARLKDMSRKQDCAVIQSLVLTAKERVAKVLRCTGERGAALEDARKRAKQFSESRQLLLDWMDEVEQTLEIPGNAAMSQEEIKCQLAEHKEFQKLLRSKRPVYEATLRSGRLLRERAQLTEDVQLLEELLGELKERWDDVGGRAVERQHKLEESLLFSGKFTDALQALLDWLYRAEPQLCEEVPVAGDRDLVSDLMDKHKAFQKELGKRASCIKMLKRSVRDLTRGSSSVDSQWLQKQMEELSGRWDLICKLSISKQGRLEASLQQAEEFHTLVRSFLAHLAESEKTLRHGVFPEEEAAMCECQSQLQELMKTLQCQQLELECITSLGEEILSACHPDSIVTIKSWITVAKSRFQEVLSWAQQQGERLQAQTARLAVEREEMGRLVDWIAAAEESLSLRDQETLPDDAQQLEELSSQHVEFMEELNRKQPDVEKVTKSCKHKLAPELGPPATRRLAAGRRSTVKPPRTTPQVPLIDLEPQSPPMVQLLHRWQQLWLLALDRQYRLQSALQRLREVEEFAHFDFGIWRKRYMQWISHRKSRILDVFRGIDRDQDGRISQREFIQSVLSSKFPTNVLEMSAVASIFDVNSDGFIDYYEFVSALQPSRDPLRRVADADQIQDEVNRQVAQCNCAKRFQVEQISANRYRFGESQQLRMVRILRSTLMVRVGGGWIALDEFLVKNDPCRVKGRTNVKINEKYLSPDALGAVTSRAGSQSAPPSKVLSPSRSNSSLSLYSSASAPSSPLARKAVLRRTRSGDRCPRSRSSLLADRAELSFSAPQASTEPAPPEPSEGPST